MPELTIHQLDAIDYRGQDACVVAGPGSGKTTVLVERYRALIEVHRFEPRNILAITFTEKAAANMKARLAELFAHDPIRLRELESAYVSTIHGLCARVLRENAIAAGIDPRFTVLDARESEEMQFSCLYEALDEFIEKRRTEALELIEALHQPDLAGDLRNAYDGIRSAGKSVAEVRAMACPNDADSSGTPRTRAAHLRELVSKWPPGLTPARRRQRDELLEWVQKLAEADGKPLSDFVQLIGNFPANRTGVPEVKDFKERLPELIASAVNCHTARFREMVFDILMRFDDIYRERKSTASRLDFNDLERLTVDLLRDNSLHKKNEVRDRVRAQFRQVMLDEFQDINEQQAELINLVCGEDVFFAVGDVNQSIYGFRHARPEIFHEYQARIRNSNKHSTELLDNFRSRGEILACVEALLNSAEGIHPRKLVAGSAFPRKTRQSIEILKVHDADKDEAARKESHWIAYRILSLRGTLQIGANGNTRSADFSDFAILCRNSESMKPILEAFEDRGIPYVCGRRQSFLLSREGLDITALLHTIANPCDGIALATLLRSNLVGVSDEALLRIRLLAGSLPGGLNVLAYDKSKLVEFAPEDAQKLARFMRNLKRWRADQPIVPLEVLIGRALSDCGFQWIPGTVKANNVESFLHLARTIGEERGLAGVLHEIESLQTAVSLESDLSDKDQGDCVQVMTAHSAKGLEFPVTIIAAMDKGTQRNAASVTFTPAFGLGLQWKRPDCKRRDAGLDDSWQLRNSEHMKEREKQEAHRLLYVAMTRAEEHLILSYSMGKNRPSNWAKIVDEFFQLDSWKPSDNTETRTFAVLGGDTFDVSIRVTESEPPPLRAAAADPVNSEGVLTVPRPGVDNQHDSAVNVSSLAVFADCPRKYYLQRYLGWNGRFRSTFDADDLPRGEDESADLAASDLGSLVHEILAGKPGSCRHEAHPEAQRLADVFLQSDLGKRAAAASQSEREWDFIVDINGTLVRGTIDLWFEENGEIVIVDYKTDARERPEPYAHQLALYGIAIKRAFGKRPAQAWLHFLRLNSPIEVPLDDAAFHRVEDLLAELARAQDDLRFDVIEGEHCRTCQFHCGLCPVGSVPPGLIAQPDQATHRKNVRP